MYKIFQELLEKNGVTAYKVGKDTKIASSTFTDWKKGRSEPKQDKLKRIADYFGVSVEYLMTGEEKKKAARPKEPYTKEDLELLALIKNLNEKQKNLIVETIKSFAPQND